MPRPADQMYKQNTLIECEIERQVRERVRSMDDYSRADREQRERLEQSVREEMIDRRRQKEV